MGRHKTGSTSLQHALAHGPLARFGILYPQTGRWGDQHQAFPAALQKPSEAQRAGADCSDLESLLQRLDQEVTIAAPRVTVLSSEVFCELAKRHPDRCTALLSHLACRWCLELIQVVRPLPGYFLSALKHQLREGTFRSRSPFSWYHHCAEKSRILDSYWVQAGLPLSTLPYNPTDAITPVLQVIASRAALGSRPMAQLQAGLPHCRANASDLTTAQYAAYLIHLVAGRARRQAPSGLLTLEQFQTLLDDHPAVLADLQRQDISDRQLLAFCQTRGEQILRSAPDSWSSPSHLSMLHDLPADRQSDWNYVLKSDLYRFLQPSLDVLGLI